MTGIARDYRTIVDWAAGSGGRKPVLVGLSEGAGLSILAAAAFEARASIAGVVAVGRVSRGVRLQADRSPACIASIIWSAFSGGLRCDFIPGLVCLSFVRPSRSLFPVRGGVPAAARLAPRPRLRH
jgi:pimeloyl-ACP methyl ester carboxylesterase